MSREEALKALEEGSKVTHKRWHKGDYAQKVFDNYLQFEDGSQCSLAVFKAIYNESWDDNDWEIIEK